MESIENKDLSDYVFVGELSLDGKLNKVTGVLPICIEASKLGIKNIILPKENAKEAAVVRNLNVIPANDLTQVVNYLNGKIKIEKEIIDTLNLAMDEGDSKGKLAMKACELHKKWLSYTWNFYSKEAHRNLGEMYTQDERFKKYYDDNRKEMAEFSRDALIEFTNK